MAKKRVKKEEVQEVLQTPEVEQVQENAPVEEEIVMSPLPSEQEPVKEEVKEVKQEGAGETAEVAKAKTYYAFCRVSGGLIVDITNSLGENSKKILISGNTSTLAADGTRIFNFRPAEFGVTELTEDEALQIKDALQPTRCWKKGFVFIVDNKTEGEKMAKEQVAKYPLQGTEQLNTSSAKEVEKFSE